MKREFWLILLSWLLIPTLIWAQDEWVVPDDKKGKLSDFAFTDSTRQLGSQIYQINCRSCHGDPGKGNFQQLNPIPGDPATDKIQHNLDGELLFKIQEGRGQMPSFKNVLSYAEIWHVISYMRSFNQDYVQEIAEKIQRGNLTYSDLKILLSIIEKHKVQAQVIGNEKGIWTPVPDAEVELFIHRLFGHLPVDEIRTTNTGGLAVFTIPDDIPGDTVGNLGLVAKLVDEEQFGPVEEDTVLQLGVETYPVPLTAQRAMWGVMKKAPLWLYFSYGGALLLVLGLLGYVLLLLRKIFYADDK